MAVNMKLAQERGLSEEDIAVINNIHEQIDVIFDQLEVFDQSISDKLTELDFELQTAWGFPKDCGYHRYAHQYAFICQWYKRTFRCAETGSEITLGKDVYERQYIPFGNCAIDLGVLNGYSRKIGNMEEVKEHECAECHNKESTGHKMDCGSKYK